MVVLTHLILLGILVLLSAFFSGTEVALVSISNIKARNLVKEKKKGAQALLHLKENPEKMLTTILIGNNVVNVAAAALATYLATAYFGAVGVGLATGVMTFIILVFGEITPKSLASTHNEKVGLMVAGPIEGLEKILAPVVYLFNNISKAVGSVFGDKKKPLMTEGELKTMVEVGVEENILGKKDKEFIEGVLEFDDISVREVMTPAVKMFCLDADMKVKKALKKVNKTRYSRIPVFVEENRDKIIGIVHLKDMMRAMVKDDDTKLKNISRKPYFTSKETIISELFKKMQKKRKHMAIVVNEFGGVEGLVTLENLLEEIVGEIRDETDPTTQYVLQESNETFLVHGETEIDDLEDYLDATLPQEGDYMTVSGLMHYYLKDIPDKNSKVDIAGYTFEVIEVEGNKTTKIRVTALPPT